MVPSPKALKLPAKFAFWREGQAEAIQQIHDAPTPVVVGSLPPGAGKTGIYMGLARWKNLRIAVVTATRNLQTQLSSEFRAADLLDIRGQSNYDCLVAQTTVDQGPCKSGYTCTYKSSGCEYYDKMRFAPKARIVVTNYSMWLTRGHEFGEFDLVVFDEAHACIDELARALSITITRETVDTLYHRVPILNWKPWAEYQKTLFKSELSFLRTAKDKSEEMWKRYNDMEIEYRKMVALSSADEHGYTYEKRPGSWHWDCVWPGARRGMLFHSGKRYLLTSGTITKKHMSLLGFTESEYTFVELPSTFPPERRPIYTPAAPVMTAKSSPSEHQHWVSLIDNILRTRRNRKGIIHTGSFKRAEFLVENSEFGPVMETNRNARDLPRALNAYARTKNGILVSPSITAGVDFPYEGCSYQIIAKIPFPDPRSPVNVERAKIDPEFAFFVTAQEIVQASGRGMRAEDDFCETFIVDGTWDAWYYGRSWQFFPRWWRKAVKKVVGIPKPPTIRSVFGSKKTP